MPKKTLTVCCTNAAGFLRDLNADILSGFNLVMWESESIPSDWFPIGEWSIDTDVIDREALTVAALKKLDEAEDKLRKKLHDDLSKIDEERQRLRALPAPPAKVSDGEAEATHIGLLDMQVCVPAAWSDEQVLEWCKTHHPCGTTNGWSIRKDGDPGLAGDKERTACADREGFVHIMLDA